MCHRVIYMYFSSGTVHHYFEKKKKRKKLPIAFEYNSVMKFMLQDPQVQHLRKLDD